jgi:hypothetical protein
MVKKILLSALLLTNSFSLQAEDVWLAFWRALIGSSSNQPTQPVTIIHVPVPAPVIDKCACDATAAAGYKMIKLDCCGAVVCESCWNGRVQKAVRNGVRPKCHACSKTFNVTSTQNPTPSAPPAQVYSNNHQSSFNNRLMCASGNRCNSVSEVKFSCGHGMCKSCLRSRKASAIKEANGGEPYVTCPICGDMLTDKILRQV